MRIALYRLLALIALFGFSTAYADIINEIGDAGETLGTAQQLPGGTTQVDGLLDPDEDIDMYGFNWGGGAFIVEGLQCFVGTCPYSDPDGQLFLFDHIGTLLAANDDGGIGLLPLISLPDLAAGLYFVAYSAYNTDPILIDGILSGWNYDVSTEAPFNYYMSISETAVPAPSTLALLGLGLAGLGLARRRKV